MLVAMLMFATAGSLHSATVTVDWLVMQSGGTPSAFDLLDDHDTAVALGSLTVTSGVVAPGMPVYRGFASGHWTSQPEVIERISGDTVLSAVEFRVGPAGGLTNYLAEILIPANQAFVLAIGGMLKNNTSSTQAIGIEARSDSGASPVTLRSTSAWSNGFIILNQSTSWNAMSQVLSPAASADGDSEFAFFDVAPLVGPNGRLRLTVPMGYAADTGDSIFIGLGTAVPEPASACLLGLGAALLVGKRARMRPYSTSAICSPGPWTPSMRMPSTSAVFEGPVTQMMLGESPKAASASAMLR
jgi:hypothetical protein